jgi:antagonist of KipI
MRGPHADRVAGSDGFLRGGAYRISDRSDRMGVRLEGSRLASDAREILSIGVVAGAVQVPHGGEPIVLLADHQTTGGYPVIATVIRSDIGNVAQAAPGEALTFREVDRDAAVAALREERRWLDAIP